MEWNLSRKQFLLAALSVGALEALPKSAGAAVAELERRIDTQAGDLTVDDLKGFERAIGFELTDEERKGVLAQLKSFRSEYDKVRAWKIDNSDAPSFVFVPYGKQPEGARRNDVKASRPRAQMPTAKDDIAFSTIVDLNHWIKTRQISAVELTKIYLERLAMYGPKLLNVVTLTEDRALAEAERADRDLARGRYRGWLHGIPYVAKDLLAAKGYPTTWGAEPFRNQSFDFDAAVIGRLAESGAVLCAKSSVGALAMDDHWFEGKTKNPWNPAQGSSGSSAGSASCTAAGLAAFSIGTETLGSIMSPSHRCRVTGLRPTFGRISRHGCMALSWTMDKVGPIGRTAQDCALILAALHGKDENDPSTVDRPFTFRPDVDMKKLKIGYLSDDRALDEDDSGNGPDDAVALLRKLGAEPTPIKFTQPGDGIDTVLSVESAAAFEEITRDRRVDQVKNSLWPGIFKSHQFTSGVGYIQAMRARQKLMKLFEAELREFDLVLAGDRGSYLLFITNLTGHPQLYVPFGTDKNGAPRGISLIGRLYDEGTILSVGAQLQSATDFWQRRPDLSVLV